MSSTREQRRGWAEDLRAVGESIVAMAEALEEDDGILGILAGEGIGNLMPALPRHIRELFTEYLSEEAALGFAADQRFYEAMSG